MQPCTCVGSCKGSAGLGEGWYCVMEPPVIAIEVNQLPRGLDASKFAQLVSPPVFEMTLDREQTEWLLDHFRLNTDDHGRRRLSVFDKGVWFQSAVSGLWYQNRDAAGDVRNVKIDGVLYRGPDQAEASDC